MNTDILVAAITAGCALLSAVVVALIQHNQVIARDVKATREQVQNSHSTNLRDDLDAMHESVRHTALLVEGLFAELRQERDERIALSDRFDGLAGEWRAACPKPKLLARLPPEEMCK